MLNVHFNPARPLVLTCVNAGFFSGFRAFALCLYLL